VLTTLINVLGYTVAAFMAVGATFGALNCMYSAIASRQVEIATLRAIGFGSTPVVVSVMIEALCSRCWRGPSGARSRISTATAPRSPPSTSTRSRRSPSTSA
jgi:putative ABC transport system permease protein